MELEETLKSAEGAVDIIARGEYDYTIRDIILNREEGGDLQDVAGISYHLGREVKHSPDRPLIEDLDALPFPAWNVFFSDTNSMAR